MGGCVNAAKRKRNKSKCYTNVLEYQRRPLSLVAHNFTQMPQQQQQPQQLGPALRLHFVSSLLYRSCPLQLSVFILGNGGITQSATAVEQAAHLGHSNSAQTPLLLRLGQRETFGSCVPSVFARN